MKKFYILALVAAMFAACATDVTEDVAIEAPETLKVSFEESTRIQLDDNKTVWTKGDLVSVFYRSDANQQWKFQGKTGDREGILKRVSAPEATKKLSKIVAVYPYSDNYYINPETCNIEATLPAEQTYLKDSYGLDGNLLVSATEFNQLYLRNVCGWLKIQLKGEGQVVKKVTLKGNNGEQVAGLIYVDSSDATATLAAERSAGGDDGVGGTLVFEDTILTEVALNCPNGVTLGSESTAFYIALPPQEFSKGLTLKVLYADGTTMTKSTSNSIEIARNTILPMSALYYDGNVPPVYELAYTTNDGEPLDPFTTEGFGANFVENIFDPATGKGALKFDGKITIIPAKAFIACTNLTQIELTKDITKIDTEAFSSCTALTVMDIPQGVKTIDNKAFYNCSGMTEITIPSSVTSIGTSSFEGCGGKANINCKIGSSYFGKAKFTEVVICNSVTSIGGSAFNGCTSLTSVTIGDKITSIGERAFYNCTSLTSVTIPNSVTEIGGSAFNGCTSLTSVTIGDSVTSIGDDAFYKCTSLTTFYGEFASVDNRCLIIDGVLRFFASKGLTEYTIPDSVTEIGEQAFVNCTSLTSVTIGDRVTSIGRESFRYCSSLTSVTIGKRVTSIGYEAFSNCPSLTSVTIGDSVTSIEGSAFYNCTSLTSVTIPNSVTSIRDYAFMNCTSLTSVTIGDSVTSIGRYAFNDCTSLKDVYYTGDLSAWCKINFSDDMSNPMYYGAKLYLNGVELTEVTIPSDMTEIKYTFTGCTSLKSVTFHKRITSIGSYAFYGCTSLTSVTIPDSVTSIGYAAFGDCTSLKEVYCKPTTPPSGGSWMFSNNASGRKIYVPRASVDAYKAASYWSDYKSDIEPYDF